MKNRNLVSGDDWETPKWLLKSIENEFGKFFDPCPLHADFNGLGGEWKDVNYINPPYTRSLKEAFIMRAYDESRKGKTCIMLLPVSTSTKIFHEYIYHKSKIRFLRGRIKFKGLNTFGEKVENKCSMHDSMLVIYKGKKSVKRKKGV